jgi:hypothetical protein
MRLLPLIGLLGLGLGCARPAERAPDPAVFAQRFLVMLDSLHLEGLPDGNQLAALAPSLDQPLIAAFRRAAETQAKFIAAHPDEKPPLIEGSLFSSLFEGPTGHSIGAIESRRDTTHVMIEYVRAEAGNPDTVRWTDGLLLRRKGPTFVVTDLEYRADWGFKPGPSLLTILREEGKT